MKKLLFTLFTSLITFGAENTPIQFISLSPQILPSTAEDPLTDLEWTLALSSVGRVNRINHELMLAAGNHGYSHEGYFVFQDPFLFEPFLVPFVLDLPPIADVNDNGLDDFFDPEVAVDGLVTEGQHANAQGGASEFTATWWRVPGGVIGSVRLDFPFLGLRFDAVYQTLHYSGQFSFEKNAGLIEGTLSLTNRLENTDTIAGPFTVQVLNPEELSYPPAVWTNEHGAAFNSITNLDLGRTRTNFVSYWSLEDGYPWTGNFDYTDWLMIISSGDADNDGILDLVEEDSSQTDRPRLELIRLPDGTLEITVFGIPGKTYTLESTSTLARPVWEIAQSIPLTTESRAITISAPGPKHFFRLRL